MLIRAPHLEGMREGKITLAYRKWKRPTVKAGGTLLTGIGQLQIEAVDEITLQEITDASARKSGFPSRDALLKELEKHTGQLYRIKLSYLGEDPRIALREDAAITKTELAEILKKLAGLDARSDAGTWVKKVMLEIDRNPGKKAAELAIDTRLDKEWLKENVRKLKNLGLTESLKPGYRLSPRGEEILAALKRQ